MANIAEDEAINDCIYAMGRALRRGRVDIDQYLRYYEYLKILQVN